MPLSDAQALWVAIAGAALAIALWAGWRDVRRRRRVDPDAVGWVDWTTVQVVALLIAVAAGWLAAKGQ